MVAPLKGHETRATNAGGEYTSFLKRDGGVIATMQYERWHSNLGEESSDVDVVRCLAYPHSVLW